MLNHGYELRKRNRNAKLLAKPLPKKHIPTFKTTSTYEPKHEQKVEQPEVEPQVETEVHHKDVSDVVDEILRENQNNQSRMTRRKRKMVSLDEVLAPSETITTGLCKSTLVLLLVFLAFLFILLCGAAIMPGTFIAEISSAGLIAYAVFASVVTFCVVCTPALWFIINFYQGILVRQWHKTRNKMPHTLAVEYLESVTYNMWILAGTFILFGMAVLFVSMVSPVVLLTLHLTGYTIALVYILFILGAVFIWMGIVSMLTYFGVK